MLKGLKRITGDFYDPTAMLSYMESGDRFLSMIVGSRSIGKSTSWAAALILDYIQRGSRWVYCRGGQGSKDAIDRTAPDFFDTAAQIAREAGYKVPPIIYKAGIYYWGDGDDAEPCGYAIPLISVQKYKSVVLSTNAHPVRWLLLDEAISEDDRYLANEADRLQRLFVTLSRYQGCPYNDDLRIILLANNVSKYGNPYFEKFGMDKYIGRDGAKIIAPGGAYWVLQFIGADEVPATRDARKSHAYIFSDDTYKKQAFENLTATDTAFIKKVTAPQTPLFDFTFDGKTYSCMGLIGKKQLYIRPGSCITSTHYAVTFEDHTPCREWLRHCKGSPYVIALSQSYQRGEIFFYNADCKRAVDFWLNYA